MRSIRPCLWFDDNLEEALEFYTSVLPDGAVHSVQRTRDGAMFTAIFEVAGLSLMGLNGGPHFHFNEAISLVLECEGQEEVDHYWDVLTADGGEESMCGWCKDRFGLSWQIVPVEFLEMMSTGSPDQAERVMAAVMQMRKPDLATMRVAFEG